MTSSSPKQESDAVSGASFAICSHAAEFLDSWLKPLVWPFVVDATAENVRDREVILGQLRRATEWLVTLSKLNSPFDYQAASAGCRALFELAVDMVLLTSDAKAAAKMAVWEDSALLRHAVCVREFRKKRGGQQEADDSSTLWFATTREAAINKQRAALGWLDKGKPCHPERWTGRKNLLEDARAADKIGSPISFEAFYETRFRLLCATTHGSGQLFRNVLDSDAFSFLGGQCYAESAKFGFLCAERALSWLDAWTPETRAQFEEAERIAMMRGFATLREGVGQPIKLTEPP